MSGSKSKSPPQRPASPASQRPATSATQPGSKRPAKPAAKGQRKAGGRRRRAARVQPADTTTTAADYSVNALSKLLGKDRRTIDKALVDVAPTRTEGKTKFYRLADVEQALRERSVKLRDDKIREEIRKLERENDFEEGKLVLRSVVCETMTTCLSAMIAILEQHIVNELPTAAAGLDVPQLRIVVKRYLDNALVSCQQLANKWN